MKVNDHEIGRVFQTDLITIDMQVVFLQRHFNSGLKAIIVRCTLRFFFAVWSVHCLSATKSSKHRKTHRTLKYIKKITNDKIELVSIQWLLREFFYIMLQNGCHIKTYPLMRTLCISFIFFSFIFGFFFFFGMEKEF